MAFPCTALGQCQRTLSEMMPKHGLQVARYCQIAPSAYDLATHIAIFALCPQLWMWSAQQCWTWLAFDLRQTGAPCLGCPRWTDPAGEHWLRWQGPSGLIGSWGIIQAFPSHWNCLSAAGSMCGLYIWVQKCKFSGEFVTCHPRQAPKHHSRPSVLLLPCMNVYFLRLSV